MAQLDRIRQLLAGKPGLKAQQIAEELGLERTQVVSALHGALGAEVTQDNAYRWWPRVREPQAAGGTAAPRTLLANLCRYYLDCLSHESGSGISIRAANANEYVPLTELPFAGSAARPLAADRAAKRMVQKVRRERGQLTLYVGYAIRLRTIRLRDEEEVRIEPVLLYPIEEVPEGSVESAGPRPGW